jgi:hypothetical protein
MLALARLVLLRRIFENIGGRAVAHAETRTKSATCLTVAYNLLVYGNDEIRLKVLERAVENKLVDKCIR